MKKRFSNKKLLGLTSIALATSIIVGTIAYRKLPKSKTGQVNNNNVYDAGNLLNFDSASAVNYATVLGDLAKYGIVSDEIYQVGHMETTFATKNFINPKGNNQPWNDDVDLAGLEPAYFVIAHMDPDSYAFFGQTYVTNPPTDMKFVIDTTSELASNGQIFTDPGRCHADLIYRTASQGDLEAKVDDMISSIQNTSEAFLAKNAFDSEEIAQYTGDKNAIIDLDADEYENATIYINVEEGARFNNCIAATEGVTIKKRPSTVVVFNVKDSGNVLLNKYAVEVDTNGDKVNETIMSDTTHSGEDSEHNKLVDEFICKKIIWNVPNASKISYNITAGLFLAPNEDTVGTVDGSSAGWIAAGGRTEIRSGEFHYINHGRPDETPEPTGDLMRLKVNKAFAPAGTAAGEVVNSEMSNIFVQKGQYEFTITETESDYTTPVQDGLTDTQKVDANGQVVFPYIEADADVIDPFVGMHRYFVISEGNMDSSVDSNIQKSNGAILVDVLITSANGKVSYVVSAKQYQDASNISSDGLISSMSNVDVNNATFSLGGFYNYYDKKPAELKLKKLVTVNGGSTSNFPSDYKAKISLKQGIFYVQDTTGTMSAKEHYFEVAKDGSVTITNLLPGKYVVEEKLDGIPGYKFESKEIDVDGSTDWEIQLDGNASKEATITNNYSESDDSALIVKKSVLLNNNKGNLNDFAEKKFEFSVKVGDYYLQDTEGTLGSTEVFFTITYDPNNASANQIAFYGIPKNTQCVVSERLGKWTGDTQLINVDGYVFDRDNSTTFTTVTTPDSSDAATAELKNTYTSNSVVGKLTLTKAFGEYNANNIYQPTQTIDPAELGDLSQLIIVLNGPKGYTREIAWSEFSNGSITIEDLPVGTYTFTEKGAEATSSDKWEFSQLVVGGYPGEPCAVNQYNPTTYKITNNYEQKKTASLAITKKMVGSGSAEKDIVFALKNAAGQYATFNASNELTGYSDTLTDACKITIHASSTAATVELKNIPVGEDFTLWEDESTAQIDGMYLVVSQQNVKVNIPKTSANQSYPVSITNTYQEYSLKVTKKVTGDVPASMSDMVYKFTIQDENGKYLHKNGTIASSAYEFEIKGDETLTIPASDNGPFTIHETTTNSNIFLELDTTYYMGTEELVDGKIEYPTDASSVSVTIVNDYTYLNKKVKVSLEASKTYSINGVAQTLAGGEFSFTLTKSGDQNPTQTKSNDANGVVTFDDLSFDTVGEYTYTVKEVKGSDTSITYDETVYTVVVNVTKNATTGELTATKTITKAGGSSVDAMTFANTKAPDKGNLKITKTVAGVCSWDDVKNTIVFTVTGPEYASEPNSQKAFTMDDFTSGVLTLEDIAPGDYTIAEITMGINGVTVTTTYKVNTGNSTTGSVATCAVAKDTTTTVDFTNTYAYKPVDVTLEATKTLTRNGQKISMTAKQFSFKLTDVTDSSNPVDKGTAYNTANGAVTFGKLSFDKPGTYKYTVEEVKGNDADITYDTTKYDVEIVVAKDATTGILTATTTIKKDSTAVDAMTFTNKKDNDVKVSLDANKTYSVNGVAQTLVGGEFSFTLTKSGEQNPTQTKSNGANGVVTFEDLSFSQPGEYTYTVKEVKGTDTSITYDDTAYTVVVTVTQDATTGDLTATKTIKKGDATVTSMTFANTKKTDVKVSLEASKTYSINGVAQALTANQ
ncbi:MAG: hypothetical protein KBT07_03775, partial [Clostridiales bacterium]|nr:hypothetical protein [Candidatus Scatonaster coprocaballi]